MPRFVAMLPVRDEADIIGQCLENLLSWCDDIFVFDTGSVDGTWEVVQNYAARDKRILPLCKDPVYFSETRVRGWMFHHARKVMRSGDWFLRVDADEFHHVPPPKFVEDRLQPHESIVYHQYYNFVLRESEVKQWEKGVESIADRKCPIEKRRQWYEVSVYSEPRMCKYRESMQWPPTVSFPYNAGYLAEERLPIRHYPHRDPLQLDRRCRLRAVMMSDKLNRANWDLDFHYWEERNWRKFITPDNAQGLRHWAPGTDLPEVHLTNHLSPPHVRLAQRLTHAFLLPILDRLRPEWPEDARPQPIPANVVSMLEEELKQ